MARQKALKYPKAKAVDNREEIQRFSIMDTPGYLFRQLQIRGSACFAAVVGVDGYTPQQFMVMLTLLQNGAMTLTDLANIVKMDRSTLGEMVHRLTVRGLIQRNSVPSDRRSIEVEITDAGREAVSDTLPQVQKAQDDMLGPLPEEYRPLFMKCLKLIAEAEMPKIGQQARY